MEDETRAALEALVTLWREDAKACRALREWTRAALRDRAATCAEALLRAADEIAEG